MRDGQRGLCRAMGSSLEGASLPMKLWPHPSELKEPEWRIHAEFSFLVALHIFAALLFIVSFVAPSTANSHPGGLAADGCHNDRKNGGRHCHRGPNAGESTRPARSQSTYYPNCAAARAAGAAPVRRGQPGYGSHLDRDGDGVGCE